MYGREAENERENEGKRSGHGITNIQRDGQRETGSEWTMESKHRRVDLGSDDGRLRHYPSFSL